MIIFKYFNALKRRTTYLLYTRSYLVPNHLKTKQKELRTAHLVAAIFYNGNLHHLLISGLRVNDLLQFNVTTINIAFSI